MVGWPGVWIPGGLRGERRLVAAAGVDPRSIAASASAVERCPRRPWRLQALGPRGSVHHTSQMPPSTAARQDTWQHRPKTSAEGAAR